VIRDPLKKFANGYLLGFADVEEVKVLALSQ